MYAEPSWSNATTSYGCGVGAEVTHAGRARRHTSYSNAKDFRTRGQQAVNLCYWHVPFNNIASYDSCVAGAQYLRDVILLFYRLQLICFDLNDCKTVLLEIHAPVVAAASSRRFVDGDLGDVYRLGLRSASAKKSEDEKAKYQEFFHVRFRLIPFTYVIYPD